MLVTINFTGIPYALHYCGMAKAYTNRSCSMCEEQSKPVEKASCCEDESDDFPVAFTAAKNCCKEHIIATPLATDIEHVIYKVQYSPEQNMVALPAGNIQLVTNKCWVRLVLMEGLPPGIQVKSLSILNSSLLI